MRSLLKYRNCFIIVAFTIIFSVFFLVNPKAYPAEFLQRLEIPSSPNPVGSGARALGMGGAFISIADDATSASWNPGGLIQLELPEISLVGEWFHRVEDNSFGTNPEAGGNQSVEKADVNYFSAAYPFTVKNYNMIVSLNYQHLYDFHRKWNFGLTESGPDWSTNRRIDYQQEGGLYALGLAYCIQATPTLSFGLTLNIWDDGLMGNKWEQTTYQATTGVDGGDEFFQESKSYDEYAFSGINANLGMMWNVNASLTVGAVLKTPFEADIEHEHRFQSRIHYPALPGFDSFTENDFSEDMTLDMPLSYGIGASYRFSDELTAALDIYRTEWGDFTLTDSDGNEMSPVTGKSAGESDIDATHQLRMGAEYLYIADNYVIPFRGGVFYDPAPAGGSPDDFYGFSLGSGIAYKRFIFDMAYQFRFGNNVGASILDEWDFSQDVSEHMIYTSIIVHF